MREAGAESSARVSSAALLISACCESRMLKDSSPFFSELCSPFLQVTLHDMILKNIEKIKRPRSSNAETLY